MIESGVTAENSESMIFEGYLKEYEQCAESYRHTYETIWQAGGLFGLVSAALVGFSSNNGSLPPLIQVLAPAPLLFWYLGIFRPMNRYGELRSKHLAELEQTLAVLVPGLRMNHFLLFEVKRKTDSGLYRFVTFKWLWRPRVIEIVTVLGIALIAAEIALIWVHYL